MLNSDH